MKELRDLKDLTIHDAKPISNDIVCFCTDSSEMGWVAP